MKSLSKYSKYKDSGVEWIREIPEHWEINKLNFLGDFSASGIDKHINKSESQVKIVNFTDIFSNSKKILTKKINYMIVTTPETNRVKNLLKKGDLIFLPSSETYEDLGKSALVNEELINTSFSYHVIRFQFKYNICHSYRKYMTNNHTILHQFQKNGKGTTRKIIGRNIFKKIIVLIPPLQEQKKIANYLDQKTEQIDKAISQKKELIKLLKERKEILIKDAITQGIDKTASMMESGIKWLGKVPKHWDIKKGKYLFKEIDERSKDGKEELLSVSHMTGVTPRSEKNVTMFMSEDYTGSKTCQKDDLVINIMWAWMGALGVSDREGIVSSSYGIYRQREPNTFNSSYLEYLLRTNDYIAEYNRRSTGLHVSRLRLYSDRFLDMKMAIPPIEEQNAIINFIKENNSKIDKAINLQEEQIERLKELKETLIDSCVTGKVKVP